MNKDNIIKQIYGMVTDNDDPEGLERLKVKLHYLGNEIETDWIPMVIPFYTEVILPDIGDMVAVAFINDDPNRGSVLGIVLNDEQSEGPKLNKGKKNSRKFIKSKNGYKIILNNTEGNVNEKIRMITPDGKQFEFSTDGENVLLKTNNINSEMKLSAKDKITINGKDGGIEISNENPNESVGVKLEVKSKNAKNDEVIKGSDVNLH
ncbi:MAG: phage baseplate assembly protein V [Leptospirales bacterium]|nr:phage baseplate assembly protein V [Leptospirales bacterium]